MSKQLPIFSILVLLFHLTGCIRNEPADTGPTEKGVQTEVIGTLEGGAGIEVMLEELGARELVPIDTVVCDTSGSFQIRFMPAQPAFYVLRYGKNERITLLLDPGERLVFRSVPGEGVNYSVEGSTGSELLHQLAGEHRRTLGELGSIARQNMDLVNDADYVHRKAGLDRRFDSITRSFHDYSLSFIRDHPTSLAILVALYNMYGEGLPVFHPEEDLAVYRFVDSALYSRYEGIEAVSLLHAQLAETSFDKTGNGHLLTFSQGDPAPDFVSARPDGSRLALSEYRGNYVLVCFWAGWSSLSREENPFLKEAFLAYHDHPFRIIQVSLDDRREIWTAAITEDGLSWDQVSDLQRWDSPVASIYHIEKIPSNVLIDPEGKVIGVDLLGKELHHKLESIFIH